MHVLLVDDDGTVRPRTPCLWWGGRWREELEGREELCGECLEALRKGGDGQQVSPEYARLDDMDRRCAAELEAGAVWAEVTYWADGLAEVRLSHPAPLPLGLIKVTYGRRWDPDRRAWVVDGRGPGRWPTGWSGPGCGSAPSARSWTRHPPGWSSRWTWPPWHWRPG